MNFISILFWLPSLSVKISLIFMGLIMVPLTSNTHPIWGNNEDPEAPAWFKPEWPQWFRQYWWRAIRNPANNLRYFFDEPEVEVRIGDENPDDSVRIIGKPSSSRFVRAGVHSEYWFLKKVSDGKFFEFRIGWKFSGVPGFAPTIQLRVGG